MPRVVVDMQETRPIWRIPRSSVQAIRAALPAGWEVVFIKAQADGTADGGGRVAQETLDTLPGAEIYVGFGVPPEVLRASRRLRWVHTGTAGVRSSLSPEMLDADVIFTNSAGVHAPPIAETVVAMIFHFARGIDQMVSAQALGRWEKGWFDTADSPVREVAGSMIGVLGYGGIGREVAARVTALGARVIGLRRRQGEPPPGVEFVYGTDGLHTLLQASDYLVVAAAHTAETDRLLDEPALERMKPGSVLINVARGRILDEDALLSALRSGRLRGAALDVFATEPLPEDHPFWRLPNVLVSPHVSGYSHRFWERETALIVENLRRYLDGRPLLNVVDKAAGY